MKNSASSTIRQSILALCLCFLSSCAYIEPLVSDVNMISVPDERILGGKLAQQVLSQMKIVRDGEAAKTIDAIGQKLVTKLPYREFDYHFYVVADKTPNAFTIPGGHIFIHTGLFSMTENKHEIAGVLAHEIGHAFERHPTKGLTRAYGINYLAGLVLDKNAGTLRTLSIRITETGILTRYGRQDEIEADHLGFNLLKQSGYSPDGLLNFLVKIQRLQRDPGLLQLLSSHPPTTERIETLKALQSRDASRPL